MNDIGRIVALALTTLAGLAPLASAKIEVTEWSYQGSTGSASGEYIELTNRGTTPIDFTGWTFNDDHAQPAVAAGAIDLSAFGVVAPNESVLIVGDATATPPVTPETFRAAWGLSASVKIISSGTIGFGRNDAANVYDPSGANQESFAFGDQNYPGTLRTQAFSGNILPADLSSPNALVSNVKSTVGDSFGSYASTGGGIGNPGKYIVPEPATLTTLAGSATLLRRRRRR